MKLSLKLTISLQCIQFIAMQQVKQHLKPFVTLQLNSLYSNQDENISESIQEFGDLFSNSHKKLNLSFKRHANFEDYYELRYRPVSPMPRIFWTKLTQRKNKTEFSTTTKTIEETEISTDLEPIETTTPLIILSTISSFPSFTTIRPTLKRRPTSIAYTTPSTIMRPPIKNQLHFFNSDPKILLFGSPFQANLLQNQKSNSKAKGKGFLGLFEIINFNNTSCAVNVDDARTMDGVCYHEFECKSLGGIPTKPCAEGAGVCCIFVTSCGDTTDQSLVYFESPNYPNPVREMMICVLIINLRTNVEQLRLDFLMFELNRPSNGDCVDDQFIVSGQNMNYAVPILCGINTGQHIYLHVGNSFENKIYLSFFAKVPKGGRSFNVKITQLEDNLAPPNCLQYFTESEGVVKSFNYDIDGTIVDNKEATYLNNLNYAICIQRAKESCSVVYFLEQGNGEVPDFQIINKDEDENDLVPDGQAGAGIFNCPDDFIAINSVRLCGERFNDGTDNEDFTMNAPVRDIAAGPILLPVRTDSEYVGRGFRLLYKQELCI